MPFPRFEDGDVDIRFTEDGKENYVLHSYVLALHSSWFKASLSGRWSGAEDILPWSRRVYELRFEKSSIQGSLMRETSVGETVMLSSATPLEDATSGSTSRLPTKSRRDGQRKRRLEVMRAHQAVLAALYHVAPDFGKKLDSDCIAFMSRFANATDCYDCSNVAAMHLRDFLSRHHDEALPACATKPYQMLEIGVKAEADWIVKESATHIICRDSATKDPHDLGRRGRSTASVLDILSLERHQILAKLGRVDSELFQLRALSISVAGRLATAYFQYCMRVERPACGSMKPRYASLYRRIAGEQGPFALTRERLEDAFGKITKEANGAKITLSDIDHYWDRDLLGQAQKLVAPLLKDVTALRSEITDDTNLRFITIADSNLPWK